jgi:mRNA interferase RelE/StbE
MNYEIKKTFARDAGKVKDKKILESVLKILDDISKAGTASQIRNIKKLKGYKEAYRIRIGDYRIGLVIDKNKTVFLVSFAHRKDIYKSFP